MCPRASASSASTGSGSSSASAPTCSCQGSHTRATTASARASLSAHRGESAPRAEPASAAASGGASPPAGVLGAIRGKLGELLGWDRPEEGVGSRVPSLRERLPADLRDAPRGPEFAELPFTPLYLLDDEFAAEVANRTVHGVLHLGWEIGRASCRERV